MRLFNKKVTCPHCGKKVSEQLLICSYCGENLHSTVTTSTVSRELGSNRQWIRRSGDFAQRFEILDIPGFFSRRLTVEQGTKVIFLQGGRYCGFLPAGVYNLGDIRDYFTLKLDERATVILVDSGNVSLSFHLGEMDDIRTKDGFVVGIDTSLSAGLVDPLSFLENFQKNRDYISLEDIEASISPILRTEIQPIVANYSVESLSVNSVLINELKANLISSINQIVKTYGLEITALTSIKFDEGNFKEVRDVRQDAVVKENIGRTHYTAATTLNSLKTAETIDEIENTGAIGTAQQAVKHRSDIAEKEHQIKLEEMEDDADFAELNRIREFQIKSAQAALDLKERELEIKRKDEAERIKNMDSASVETKIILNGGSAEDVRKLEEMKRAASLTPEQILALHTNDPKAAGEALAANARLDSLEELNALRLQDQMAFNQMMQNQYRENAEQMKEVMNSALSAMGSTATARSTAQNPGATVVASGVGAPLIVNPSKKVNRCPSCNAEFEENYKYCPLCSEKLE